jgi:hypothetical protein
MKTSILCTYLSSIRRLGKSCIHQVLYSSVIGNTENILNKSQDLTYKSQIILLGTNVILVNRHAVQPRQRKERVGIFSPVPKPIKILGSAPRFCHPIRAGTLVCRSSTTENPPITYLNQALFPSHRLGLSTPSCVFVSTKPRCKTPTMR